MKAKEKLIKLVLDNDFITAPSLRAEFRSLLDRVEIEARAEFKNYNIPPVMGELTCDSCGCHPNVIYTTSSGRFCERCKPAS